MTGAPASAAAPKTSSDVVVTAIRHPQPADAPPPLEIYAKPAKFEQIALSGDGAQVAFITRYEGLRLLISYRFADQARRMVRLTEGDISSLSFADDDHLLVSSTRPITYGTCDSADETAISTMAAGTLEALEENGSPQMVGDFLRAMRDHPCTYFGVRAQEAVTTINMAKGSGRQLGLRWEDVGNWPLGTPQTVTMDGKSWLLGPFLETGKPTTANHPAERIYLWRQDPKGDLGQLVKDGAGDIEREEHYAEDWLVTGDGRIVARSAYNFDDQTFVIQMRVKGAWKPVLTRKIAPKDHTLAPFMIGLGHDDSAIIILDAAASGAGGDTLPVYHFYRLSADGSLSAPLEPNDAAHDRPLFDPRTGRLAGFAQNGETETYGLDDPALQALYDRAGAAAPGETVRVVSTAADPRKMVIYAQGREDPGAYYFLDFAAGTTANLGEDYQDLPTEWIAEQKPISYRAGDGLEIHALLTLPPKAPAEASNLPLVVLPHDGPQAHDGQGFYWLAQALASRGYVVLQPNYRGSDGYGPAFIAAGYDQGGRKMQSDLSDGVRSLVAEGLVDPKRVCVLGVGLGGYAALIAAATQGETYRCAGAINGVSDPTAYAATLKSRLPRPEQDLITPLAPDPHWPRAFITDPASPRVFAAYYGAGAPSPVKLAGQVGAPVLLVDTADDRNVPASQSQRMRDALTAAGKPVQLVELKGAEHAPASQATRLATLTAVMDFLARNNPD